MKPITLQQYLQEEDFIEKIFIQLEDGSNINGLLSDVRLGKSKDNLGKYIYEIRHDDHDPGILCTIEHNVLVNFAGSLILNEPLEIEEDEFLNIKDWSFDYE